MDNLQASPQNSTLAAIAELLLNARTKLNTAGQFLARPEERVRQRAAHAQIGEALLGKSPEEVENWSYGNDPFKTNYSGISSRLLELQERRKQQVADTILALPTGAAAKVASMGAGVGPEVLAAVKGAGGMWHPEASKLVADTLRSRLTHNERFGVPAAAVRAPDEAVLAQETLVSDWADKVSQRYLSRHAGQPTDPLKDVVLPSGKRWEEVTDAIVHNQPGRYYFESKRIAEPTHAAVRESLMKAAEKSGAPASALDEPVWNLGAKEGYFMGGVGNAQPSTPYAEFKDYIKHTGDYLKQNVRPGVREPSFWLMEEAPEGVRNRVYNEIKKERGLPIDKPLNTDDPNIWLDIQHKGRALPEYKDYQNPLAKYDLARAVGETYQNDLRVKREMERQFKLNTQQLPVHKEYPEHGMRWVELKQPEKLTEEQAATVKRSSMKVQLGENEVDLDMVGRGGNIQYRAYDAKGKPIQNSYTGGLVDTGNSPEEAWLKGQLAQEGNVMGHCVGGYCSDVTEGRSKIYSLRDAKGESHVTIEVKPNKLDAEEFWANAPDEFKKEHVKPSFAASKEFMRQKMNLDSVTRMTPREGRRLQDSFEAFYRQRLGEWQHKVENTPEFQQEAINHPPHLAQIMGKQDKAPVEQYMPFVHDFVKSGKWSGIDNLALSHSGLVKGGGKYLDLIEAKEHLNKLINERRAARVDAGPTQLKHGTVDSYIWSYLHNEMKDKGDIGRLIDLIERARPWK